MEEIIDKVSEAVALLLERAGTHGGEIFVLGTSTSEVVGRIIGQGSNSEAAAAIWRGVNLALQGSGIYLAVQCCEHLNRALVVEKACLREHNLTEVQVVPIPHAGGAMAAYAFAHFHHPVIVESVQAVYGMDIGLTLIGMHLKPVAVPVRVGFSKIGAANFTLAYSRPKLIGGERAVYNLVNPGA